MNALSVMKDHINTWPQVSMDQPEKSLGLYQWIHWFLRKKNHIADNSFDDLYTQSIKNSLEA